MNAFQCGRLRAAAMAMLLVGWCAAPCLAHVIQAGDELLLVIPAIDPPRQTLLVDMRGTISLGLYGSVQLAGLELEQAPAVLVASLKRYLRSTAGISVQLSSAGRLVLVSGGVLKPGLVRLTERDGVWEAIQKAGGPLVGAALHRVRRVSPDGEEIIDLRAFLTGGDGELSRAAKAGDVIVVPTDSARTGGDEPAWAVYLGEQAMVDKVIVMGAVREPGVYQRSPALTVLSAIALAGGALPEAALGSVRVLSMGGSEDVNLSEVLGRPGGASTATPLPRSAGVVVYVPAFVPGRHNPLVKSLNVVGGVRSPGTVPVSGEVSLVDAVALAGGPTDDAVTGRVHVVRVAPRWSLATSYDLEDAYKAGGLAAAVVVKPGDTISLKQRAPVWRTVIQVISDLVIISTSVALLAGFTR